MNKEYEIRRQKAEEISKTIGDLAEGILIVGSVAYNPQAVTEKSDLDMVIVIDFSSIDFKEWYSRLGQKYEPLIVKYASEDKIHNVSIVWDTPNFEIGLHFWDKKAFQRVVNLEEYNLIFRRKDFSRNFKSTADIETLKNLRGIEKQFFKEPQDVEDGTILKFFIYNKDNLDFYPGIQICNLLLDPVILKEKNRIISKGLGKFIANLKKELKIVYKNSSESINLYNSLSDKLKEKIPSSLKIKLKNFF